MDGRARLGGGTPELGGLEADAVERVGLRALSMCVGVRKDEGPVHANDDAELAARVARQPRVSDRRVMTRDDVIAERAASGRGWSVVTSDRGLAARVERRQVEVVAPAAFIRQIEETSTSETSGTEDWDAFFSDPKNRLKF